jgi:5-formyltetrahydrofolate cyclo-ligase
MPSPSDISDRSRLRRELRAARRALSPAQQKVAAHALARRLAQLPALRRATRIALYWPMDGEIDPRALRQLRHFSRHRFYLPVLQRFPAGTLRFAPWQAEGRRMLRNRFGIPEPRGRVQLTARHMDAILLPLTGFDAQGNRLGMGGGFYDRTLAGLRHRHHPLLVGVSHACQEVAALPLQPWDVPLALVVTDRHTFRCRPACRAAPYPRQQ